MTWQKLGKIFEEKDGYSAVPTIAQIDDNKASIIYATRDKLNRSIPKIFTINLDTLEIIAQPQQIMELGNIGCFDDSGVMPCWQTNVEGQQYLYYIGWNTGLTVPFRNSVGVAVKKNETYQKLYQGPILDRTKDEPHFVASCCVIEDGGVYKMWYLSCVDWQIVNKKPTHFYHIKYAESKNGIDWNREGKVAIDFANAAEYAISRPCVIKEDGIYKMWFSARGDFYKIYYAESKNGVDWTRNNDPALEPSGSGWDCEMVEYPYVFSYKSKNYMIYNGNNFGRFA